MNRICIILIFVISFHCSAGNSTKEISDRKFAGWQGSSETLNEKPFNYYYDTREGTISSKSLIPNLMEKNCIDSILIRIPEKLVAETLDGFFSCPSECEFSQNLIKKIIKDLNLKAEVLDCLPLAARKKEIIGTEWKECKCVAYVKVDRNSIKETYLKVLSY